MELLLWKSHPMIPLIMCLEKNIQVEYKVWETEFVDPKFLVHPTHDMVAFLLLLVVFKNLRLKFKS